MGWPHFLWYIVGQPADHMSTECFLTFRIVNSHAVLDYENKEVLIVVSILH